MATIFSKILKKFFKSPPMDKSMLSVSINKGVGQIVGKTITHVVASENDREPYQKLYLIFSDNTHYEIYGDRFYGNKGVDRGGLDTAIRFANSGSASNIDIYPEKDKKHLHECFHLIWSRAANAKYKENAQYDKYEWKKLESLLFHKERTPDETEEMKKLIETLQNKEQNLFTSSYEKEWKILKSELKR